MAHGKCSDCYWVRMVAIESAYLHDEPDDCQGIRLECHLNPPTPTAQNGFVQSLWPLVAADDFCSLYLPVAVTQIVVEPEPPIWVRAIEKITRRTF